MSEKPGQVRKFYIGDKVQILFGEHAGRVLYVCGKSDAEGYICCGVAPDVTVRFSNIQAKILNR